MIEQSSIQQVMSHADIVEILGQFLRLKKRGAGYIANCPFHNEKTPSFHVSAAKGIYKCFGCGKAGNVVTFIQDHEKLSYPEAIRWLADFYKIPLQETERSSEQKAVLQVEESLRIINDYAAGYFHNYMLSTEEGQLAGLSYFKERGFRKETIEKFKLGFCSDSGTDFSVNAVKSGYNTELLEKAGLLRNRNGLFYDAYRGRVIFPIHGMTGKVLGFGARLLKSNEKAPKYINTAENELYIKSRVLYGMYQARQAIGRQDECFLVEGYTDVISMHQAGVENVVASSGTSLTEDQLRLIGRLTRNLTILYDGDSAGIKAALRGLDMALSQSFNVQLVLLPDGEDPDSFIQNRGVEGFYSFVKNNKKDVISFRLDIGLQDAGNDPFKKSKLTNEIAESISKINKAEDFALQEYFIKEASARLGVEESGLINLVNKFIRDRLQQDKKELPAAVPALESAEPEALTELPGLRKTDISEPQEWELVRTLIENGAKAYEEGISCSKYIEERIDIDLFESELARELYSHYFNYLNEHHRHPDALYFMAYPSPEVQTKIAELLQPKENISHNWKEKYGIVLLHGTLNYLNEVESAVAYFELKKLKLFEMELMDKMQEETQPEKQMRIMAKLIACKKTEKEILQKARTAILKYQKNN